MFCVCVLLCDRYFKNEEPWLLDVRRILSDVSYPSCPESLRLQHSQQKSLASTPFASDEDKASHWKVRVSRDS